MLKTKRTRTSRVARRRQAPFRPAWSETLKESRGDFSAGVGLEVVQHVSPLMLVETATLASATYGFFRRSSKGDVPGIVIAAVDPARKDDPVINRAVFVPADADNHVVPARVIAIPVALGWKDVAVVSITLGLSLPPAETITLLSDIVGGLRARGIAVHRIESLNPLNRDRTRLDFLDMWKPGR
jgi:hypothetical protein